MEVYNKPGKDIGDIVKMVCNEIYALKKFQNVLFVRTQTTGPWMDDLFHQNSINVIRIMYNCRKSKKNPLYKHLPQDAIQDYLKNLNIQFDAIIIDTYHEYKESSRDFSVFPFYLNNNGVFLSHDCSPQNKEQATPKFKPGPWSGVNYICFVEFALNNPEWYYAIIDNDTGIGIMSKQQFTPLIQGLNFDKVKQQQLISLKDNNAFSSAYDFFKQHGKELINLI